MEWIVGVVIFVLLWKLLSGKSATEAVIKKELSNAVALDGELHFSKLLYRWFKEYGENRGSEESIYDDGGRSISFEQLVNGKEMTFIVTKSRVDDNAVIGLVTEERQRRTRESLSKMMGFDVNTLGANNGRV